MATSRTRVVAYLRVSTEEQAAEGVSLDAQEHRVRAYAELHGFDLVEVVVDRAVSGAKPLASRVGGRRILSLIRRRRVAGVVALKLDRLFRDCADCLQVVRDWDRAGVALHMLDLGGQNVDTSSAMGRFFLTIMAGAAEMERGLIAERTRVALAHKRMKGERISRWIPYGHRLSEDGIHLVKAPEEQRAIKLIRRLRSKGYSLRKLAEHLNEQGIPARGKAWHKTTITRVLARDTAA